MLFTSRLCQICEDALRLVFESIDDRKSSKVAHHPTKESLIDSVLHRSCHLCRFIVYHFKIHWAPLHRQGLDDLREEPTSLTENDFILSDFDFASFSNDRMIIRSYFLELPEDLNFQVCVNKHGDGSGGVFGIVEFTCNKPNPNDVETPASRFWTFDERAFGGPPIMNRYNGNTSSADCRKVLEEWLNQCSSHNCCTIHQQSFLPTRLLDLSDVGTKGQVHLILTKDIDKTACYVTLSHCWGGNVPFQLKKGTMERMIHGFKLSELPETFRHAIEVAGWVGVRYLWIDSCCIVQDSKSDWEKEARMMQKVYRNTYFNISADHSENSRGGCFIDRLAYKITPCPFTAPDIGKVFLLPQFDLTKPLAESTISTRAWVTQERFLAPRILHFTTDQLFWECAGLYACETFPKGVPHVYDDSTSWYYRTPIDHSLVHPEENRNIYKAWGRVCQDYSQAKLTYTSDKLVAFAGIASEFQLRLPEDIYLAGLWKADLITGLLWKAVALDGWPTQANGSHEPNADPYITATMPNAYRAPSWSWLAKDCGISWQTRQRYSAETLVTILDASVDLVRDTEPTGDIRGGKITVQGYLRAAQWKQDGHITSIILDGKSGHQLFTSPEDSMTSSAGYFRLQRDTGISFPVKDIYCLLVRLSLSPQANLSWRPMIEGLVLGRTGKKDEYERLGYFEALGHSYGKTLLYELRGTARDLEQPWGTLELQLPQAEDENESAATPSYDETNFCQLQEQVLTIV